MGGRRYGRVAAAVALIASCASLTSSHANAAPRAAQHATVAHASLATLAAAVPNATIGGYRIVGADGAVFPFGASYAGSMAGHPLDQPVVGMASTPSGGGYWLVATDGGIFSFGDASFHGSTGGIRLNRPIVGMTSTRSGSGYWFVASDGGVFSFGDARFYGSTGGIRLDQPIVGMAPTPSGLGYWLVASDGGIFSFGDARFYGSTGGIRLDQPIVGMAPTPSGQGYWLVASDGGIFSFGDARFYGSTGGIHLLQPIVGMAATRDAQGYWLVARDGGLFTFGDAPFFGSAFGRTHAPVVGIARSDNVDPYVPGTTGYDISWPQCGGAYPPPPHAVTIVGVNDGHMYSTNPCVVSEVAWAGSTLTAYVNTNHLPNDSVSGVSGPAGVCAVADRVCRAYNWGRGGAEYDAAAMQGHGVNTGFVWLDVELDGGWLQALPTENFAVIRGVRDGLRLHGYTVGIYATNYQWGFITSQADITGMPIWVPGAADLAGAVAMCAPIHSFGGGITWLTQWTVVYDQDYACPVP
jgi:hypothetical protein